MNFNWVNSGFRESIMSRCILLLALLAEFSYSKESFFTSIQRTFETGAQPKIILMLALTGLALIGIIVVVEIRKSDARSRAVAQIGWKQFYEKAKETGLNTSEIDLLEKMVSHASPQNAGNVFTSPTVFETVVEKFFQEKMRKGGITNDVAELVHDIRDRLGYSNLAIETPYVSSRQFREFDRLLIQLGDQSSSGAANIEKNTELYWIVSNPFSTPPEKGSELRISHTRAGDAEYTVAAVVSKVLPDGIQLEHTRNLTRKQLRSWVRIDLSLPAKVKILSLPKGVESPFEPGEVFIGRLMDLSGGGVSVRIPAQLPKFTDLGVDFDLPDVAFRNVPSKVVRISPTPTGNDQQYPHSMEFIELEKVLQEKIVRFVFEKQRQESQWR